MIEFHFAASLACLICSLWIGIRCMYALEKIADRWKDDPE